jgi:hypothetical protein
VRIAQISQKRLCPAQIFFVGRSTLKVENGQLGIKEIERFLKSHVVKIVALCNDLIGNLWTLNTQNDLFGAYDDGQKSSRIGGSTCIFVFDK